MCHGDFSMTKVALATCKCVYLYEHIEQASNNNWHFSWAIDTHNTNKLHCKLDQQSASCSIANYTLYEECVCYSCCAIFDKQIYCQLANKMPASIIENGSIDAAKIINDDCLFVCMIISEHLTMIVN